VSSGTYTYRVRSFDGPNDSAPSGPATATTLGVPAAAHRPHGHARLLEPHRPGLDGQRDGEQGFRIERSSDGVNFTPWTTVGANVTTYSMTALTANTTYAFRVKAYEGPTTRPLQHGLRHHPRPPPAPSGLTATPVSSTRIDLVWTDNSGYESGYAVERATGAGSFTVVAYLAANATGYSSTSLAPGTTYSFRVRAYDASNYSAYSNTASPTTP
jgi:titin